jgi:predicted regulator of Ras-like GTPase activity (Roadblock/LC7/MglB family)
MSKQEALTSQIADLCDALPDVHGVLLATSDGLPIAHSLSNGSDPARLSAMAVAAAKLGARVSNAIDTGEVAEVSIRAGKGDLFVYTAGNQVVLAVLSPKNGNAGLINLEARNTASQIAALLG